MIMNPFSRRMYSPVFVLFSHLWSSRVCVMVRARCLGLYWTACCSKNGAFGRGVSQVSRGQSDSGGFMTGHGGIWPDKVFVHHRVSPILAFLKFGFLMRSILVNSRSVSINFDVLMYSCGIDMIMYLIFFLYFSLSDRCQQNLEIRSSKSSRLL